MRKNLGTFLWLLPVIVSMLLIGAHFLRSGSLVLVAVSLMLLLVLLIRHPLAARLLQLALLLATVEWVRTAFVFIMARAAAGLPWVRLAWILGAVAGVSAAAIFVFCSKTLKERYRL